MTKIIWLKIKNHSFLLFTLFFLVILDTTIPKTSDLALETTAKELCNSSLPHDQTEHVPLYAELKCASAIGTLYAVKAFIPILRF